MRFEMKIDLGNAEMLTMRDVARALKSVAARLEAEDQAREVTIDMVSDTKVNIRDVNGNTVGFWNFTDEED